MQNRSLEFVTEQLSRCRNAGRPATLVVGPGCSVSAGIPDAAGWAALVRERFPAALPAIDDPPTVAGCLAAVGPGLARELIEEVVAAARVNAAHAAVAELVHAGIVDRVLTVNFDDLILRACLARGVFPAVYDASVAERLEIREPWPKPSLVYLRGQRSGYDFLDHEDAVRRHAERLAPLVARDAGGRPWIAVGCDGEASEPLVRALESAGGFEYHLFWATTGDRPVDAAVASRLGSARTRGVAVPGYSPEAFLDALLRRLGVAAPTPPAVAPEPITRAKNGHSSSPLPILATIATPPPESEPPPVHHRMRSLLEIVARENAELVEDSVASPMPPSPTTTPEPAATEEEVLPPPSDRAPDPELVERAVALAYAARDAGGNGESTRLFEEAERLFDEAAFAGPGSAEVLDRWGAILLERAKSRSDERERGRLFASAQEKCAAANAARRGQGAYNLACIAALHGRAGEARDWLEIGAESGALPRRGHLLADSDLDPVRDEPWFPLILERANAAE